jgi:hypothetical protein
VEHLARKLSVSESAGGADQPVTATSEDQVSDLFKTCEKKLTRLSEDASTQDEQIDDLLNNTDVQLPPENLRVRVDDKDDDDDDGRGGRDAKDDDGDDDPHDRVALKKMSESAVDRETQKNRRRRKKKDEEL